MQMFFYLCKYPQQEQTPLHPASSIKLLPTASELPVRAVMEVGYHKIMTLAPPLSEPSSSLKLPREHCEKG